MNYPGYPVLLSKAGVRLIIGLLTDPKIEFADDETMRLPLIEKLKAVL